MTRVERVEVTNTIIQQQTIIAASASSASPGISGRSGDGGGAWNRWDPLAQTFSFTENRIISAIGLFFTRKDASTPVTVQIRGVTTGLPNESVLAQKVVSPAEMNLNAETKVTFSDPVRARMPTPATPW